MFAARIQVTTAFTEELDPVSAAPLVVRRVLELVVAPSSKSTVSVVLKMDEDELPGSGGDKPPPGPASNKPVVDADLQTGGQDSTSILNDIDLTQQKKTSVVLFF